MKQQGLLLYDMLLIKGYWHKHYCDGMNTFAFDLKPTSKSFRNK